MLPPSTTGWAGSAASRAAISEDVWSCPWCRSRRWSGPDRDAGTGPPRKREPGRSRHRPARPTCGGRPASAARWSGIGRVIEGEVADQVRGAAQADAGSTSGPSARVPAARRGPRSPRRGGPSRRAVVDRDTGSGIGQEARQSEARSGPGRGPSPAGRAGRLPGSRKVRRVEVEGSPSSSSSLQLSIEREEEGHAEQRREDPDDPKADRDLLLVPAAELEVVMDRAHPEETLATRSLEVGDLDDHRRRLDDEDDADQGQDEDLAGDQRGDRQRCGRRSIW